MAIDAVKRLSLGETDAMRLAMRIGDYLERLPSAQPEQRWIPCSERLPEDDRDVLAYDGEYVFIAHFISGVWYDNSLYQLPVIVSYWMPLPELPEVEDVQG